MATASFEDTPGAIETNAPTAETASSTAVAPATSAPPALPSYAGGQFEGEFSRRDVGKTYLGLVQKISKLVDEGISAGSYVYDKSIELGKTLTVVFKGVRKFYVEELEEDAETIPQRYTTAAEFRAAGKSLQGTKGIDKVVEAAELDLLIEVPADHPAANVAEFTVGDKAYLLCTYTVRKGAFRATVRVLVADMMGWLKGDLHNGKYTLGVTTASWQSRSWYEPTLKVAGPTSEELRTALKSGGDFFGE